MKKEQKNVDNVLQDILSVVKKSQELEVLCEELLKKLEEENNISSE